VKASIGIVALAFSCMAAPVHVTVEGKISAMVADSLGMADSLGLALGSPVKYELKLDYGVQPVLRFGGLSQTLNDTLQPNGDSVDYFGFQILDGRIVPPNPAPMASAEFGQFTFDGLDTHQFLLGSAVFANENSYVAFALACQEPTGRLQDTSSCQVSEILVADGSPVFEFRADIEKITIHSPTAARPSLPPRKGMPARIPGTTGYRFQGKVYGLDGRAR
jgi:hypothetical protein